MPFQQGSSTVSAVETVPLLKDSPPAYYNSLDDEEVPEPLSPIVDPPLLNNFSSRDVAWILAGLWSAVFLGALGEFLITIPVLILDPIYSYHFRRDFNKSNQASYIGTSYLLSLCCFTPLYGRLSDILGRKGAMLLALFLFGSGTILCGMVPSMETLILARALAGMGGGGVMTVSTIVVTDLIPLKQRGLYQGMANILFGLGAGIGGPLGGWINDVFGWRSAFYFQAPLLIFSATLVAWKVNIQLPSDVQDQPLHEKLRRIDVLGSLTLVGTVGCLLLGFSLKTTEEIAWSHPLIYSLFVASFICAVSFIYVETYWAPFPVMPLRLITRRTPFAVSLSNLFASMAAFSMLYNVPLVGNPLLHASFPLETHQRSEVFFCGEALFSRKLRYETACLHQVTVLHSDWTIILIICDKARTCCPIQWIAISCGSVTAGWLMRRTGKLYTLTLAAAASSISANVLVIFWNENTSGWHLWLDIVPQGFGMASFITTTLIAMIAGVVKEDMPVATGITYLFRTTGQVLGVSLSGAILQAVLLQKLRMRIQDPRSAEIIYEIRHSAESIRDLDPRWKTAAIDSYADALRAVFIFQAAMAFLAFLSCLSIQENPLPGTRQEQEEHYRNQELDRDTDDGL
ncbi:Vacuolar amino acid permease [Mycena sanguinolenta]|uniref:Vacuolar amino acid permease n=1 Tax=Mycena sanguinolenta TaxID=230812 RepID=A0A8H6YB90_9AGAR|nr:Vacuolar amino acid permease [Mycena sanguinolenta]